MTSCTKETIKISKSALFEIIPVARAPSTSSKLFIKKDYRNIIVDVDLYAVFFLYLARESIKK